MAFPAKAIANELLEIARSKGITDISPMKLQKLVYYAHGWWLGVTDAPLIEDQVEAWAYGPVVPSLYDAARVYGNQPIDKPLKDLTLGENSQLVVTTPRLPEGPDSHEVRNCLNWVIDAYGNRSAVELSNLTHQPNSPWHNTVRKAQTTHGHLPRSTDIPLEEIRTYFAQKAASAEGGDQTVELS